ncbi:hypothetical protein JGS22_024290 [Streptomyces sp. P38-E01]|uniref:SalK n=1 Tax=Streptomyces tardus TaxID=2780544 RepID=A0A949JSY2_9ACTN|nr:hypothetical protein [Streptomyces tardus]MBU7600661.1 hypothetical protein [Streptomyces tardus]
MTLQDERAGRRCHSVVNPIHSAIYFSKEINEHYAAAGVSDPLSAYLAARAAPMGAVGAGTVTATFYSFGHRVIAERVPQLWETITPQQALETRLEAVDALLRRLWGEDGVASEEVSEAAELALRASEACGREARPLYAGNADLPVPEAPHLALWHACTLLREHRGDGHLAVLAGAGLSGLDAQATHTASGRGMSTGWVLRTRGFTRKEWEQTLEGLTARGLLTADHELTEEGLGLRKEIERRTDELDRAPYEHLGATGVARLTELAGQLTLKAAESGAFPQDLIGK